MWSQSWNQINVLGCILSNDPAHTLYINVKMILKPEKHWLSVRKEKKGTRKSAVLMIHSEPIVMNTVIIIFRKNNFDLGKTTL